jgi:nitroreductase
MDLFTTIKERRSCRSFLPEQVGDEAIMTILKAAVWAPSAKNAQPWEFTVITNQELKEKIQAEAEECKKIAIEKSGWKWLERYQVDFLPSAPVIIAVVGNPDRAGADMFLEGGGMTYRDSCAAAVQNMLLAAHAIGLGSLWFTLYRPEAMRSILGLQPGKVVVALVCLGRPGGEPLQTKRKDALELANFIR